MLLTRFYGLVFGAWALGVVFPHNKRRRPRIVCGRAVVTDTKLNAYRQVGIRLGKVFIGWCWRMGLTRAEMVSALSELALYDRKYQDALFVLDATPSLEPTTHLTEDIILDLHVFLSGEWVRPLNLAKPTRTHKLQPSNLPERNYQARTNLQLRDIESHLKDAPDHVKKLWELTLNDATEDTRAAVITEWHRNRWWFTSEIPSTIIQGWAKKYQDQLPTT